MNGPHSCGENSHDLMKQPRLIPIMIHVQHVKSCPPPYFMKTFYYLKKKLNWSCEAEAPHLKLIYYKISVNEKSTLWIEFGSTPVRLKKLALVYPRIRDSFDKEALFSDFLKWLVKSVWITYDNIFNPQLIHCWAMFCSFSRFHFKKHVFLRFS